MAEDVKEYEVKLKEYGDLMHKCFAEAMTVMENGDLFIRFISETECATLPEKQQVQTEIAIHLFNRSTRESPGQDKIFSLGLEFLGMLMKEKEADRERSEKLRAEMPIFSTSSSFPPPGACKHPELKALYEVLEGKPYMDEVVESLIGVRPPHNDINALGLVCPRCRRLLSVEKFKSGELWEEEAE